MAKYHLAQLNVGHLKAPVGSAEVDEFVALLGPINSLADEAPGFVWRLQGEGGNATAYRMLHEPNTLVNMSVWESLEDLADFVYKSAHRQVMLRRREWFFKMGEPYLVLWWVPAGHVPSLDEAEERLLHFRANGPSSRAFNFRHPFPPPEGGEVGAEELWTCPVG